MVILVWLMESSPYVVILTSLSGFYLTTFNISVLFQAPQSAPRLLNPLQYNYIQFEATLLSPPWQYSA